MPRCKKKRCCRSFKSNIVYKPRGVKCHDISMITIGLDEFEAMRLCDLEEYDQEAAGKRMGVSRGTIQRMVNSARKKLVEAILSGKAICIAPQLNSNSIKNKE